MATELFKLRKQKKSMVLLILTLVATLLLNVGNLIIGSNIGFKVIESAQMPLWTLSSLSGLWLPMVVFIMAVDSTSTEMTSGTIKYGFMAPMSRSKILLNKFSALLVYNGALLAGVVVVSYVINLFTMNGSVVMTLISGLSGGLITMIPLSLISLLGLLFGMYFSSGLSIGLGVIGVLAINVLQVFVPVAANLSPVAYMDLYSHILYSNTSLLNLVSMLMYLLSYYIILVAISVYGINKKEL